MLAADSGEALSYFLADLLAFSFLTWYFILNHRRERCFLPCFEQSECCACRLPKPCCLTLHSSFDLSEFHESSWPKCSPAPCFLSCCHGDSHCLCKGQPCLTVISSGASIQRTVRMEVKSTKILWNEQLLTNLIFPWSKGNHLQGRGYGKELLWIQIYVFLVIWNSTV